MRRPWAVPLLVALLAATTWNTAVAQSERVALAGHVPQALGSATRIAATPADAATAVLQPVTLTVVLKRTDPQGFAQFLADVYDPKSAQRGHFLSAAQLAERFGPSPSEYDLVRSYFTSHGFNVAEDSANRLTLTVSGTRAMAQAALGVAITDYRIPTANGLAMRELSPRRLAGAGMVFAGALMVRFL
jgi:kumamolisin